MVSLSTFSRRLALQIVTGWLDVLLTPSTKVVDRFNKC